MLYQNVLSPLRVGKHVLKNRISVSPTRIPPLHNCSRESGHGGGSPGIHCGPGNDKKMCQRPHRRHDALHTVHALPRQRRLWSAFSMLSQPQSRIGILDRQNGRATNGAKESSCHWRRGNRDESRSYSRGTRAQGHIVRDDGLTTI